MQTYIIASVFILIGLAFLNAIKTLHDIEEKEQVVSSITLSGQLSAIRQNFPGKTDIEILKESADRFKDIFANSMTLIGREPNDVDTYFDCQVFFSLTDRDVMVSKATAKNDEAIDILNSISKMFKNGEINL